MGTRATYTAKVVQSRHVPSVEWVQVVGIGLRSIDANAEGAGVEEQASGDTYVRLRIGTRLLSAAGLIARADQNGSRINDGIAESLDFVLNTHSVGQGKAKTVALILSDMLDNHPDQQASEKRLLEALTRYAQRGAIAFYFCDQNKLSDMRKKMRQAGFRWSIIESDIHGNPPLPSFE